MKTTLLSHKFRNFFAMGLVAAAFMNVAVPSTHNQENFDYEAMFAKPVFTGQIFGDERAEVSRLKANGVIPNSVDVSFSRAGNKMAEEENQSQVLYDLPSSNCKVEISLGPDDVSRNFVSKRHKEILKDVTGASNQTQVKLRNELLINHEVSHCSIYEIKDLFKTGNANVDLILNKFFKHSGNSWIDNDDYADSSTYSIIHENYADVHAFVQMLQKHGPTSDVLETIQKIQIERHDSSMENHPNSVDEHDTSAALKELLKEENIRKALSLKNQEEIQNFSLAIAGKGLMQVMVNSPGIRGNSVANIGSLSYGAWTVLEAVMKKDLLPAELDGNIKVNWDGNETYKVAKASFENFKKTYDTSWIKSEADFSYFLFKESPTLQKIIWRDISAATRTKETLSISNDENIFSYMSSYINTFQPEPKMTVAQIKAQGEIDIKRAVALSKILTEERLNPVVADVKTAGLTDFPSPEELQKTILAVRKNNKIATNSTDSTISKSGVYIAPFDLPVKPRI